VDVTRSLACFASWKSLNWTVTRRPIQKKPQRNLAGDFCPAGVASLSPCGGGMAADWEGIHPRQLRKMEGIRELDMEELNVETEEEGGGDGDEDEEEDDEEEEEVDYSRLLAVHSFRRSSLNTSHRHAPFLQVLM
jgi:hypothetical protein